MTLQTRNYDGHVGSMKGIIAQRAAKTTTKEEKRYMAMTYTLAKGYGKTKTNTDPLGNGPGFGNIPAAVWAETKEVDYGEAS
jgi:hypothetical protein